jgi:N-acetylglucosaminyldiphosphoundecaprenol N-acetyl-beta-D-mannosaminyltransferase
MSAVTESVGRANILGVGIDAVDLPMAIKRVEAWIDTRNPSYAIFRDAHGVMLCRHDARLRRIHKRAGLVGADGMPLVWLVRWQNYKSVRRVYGPDFMTEFCRSTSQKRYRHFFYGATLGTIERLVARLREQVPDLQLAGALAPPFGTLTGKDDAAVVAAINAARPDIVWVGLSTPKQEYWVAEHRGRLTAPALMAVGAAFDFNSGEKPQAPRWMRKSGLEWAFRLCSEPKRLARRYAAHIPAFVFLAVLQAVGLKKFRTG